MRVVLLSGEVLNVNCDPTDLWSVFRMVRDGELEAFIKHHDRTINARKVDPDKTFGDLIAEGFRATEPPPTLPTGEMAVTHK